MGEQIYGNRPRLCRDKRFDKYQGLRQHNWRLYGERTFVHELPLSTRRGEAEDNDKSKWNVMKGTISATGKIASMFGRPLTAPSGSNLHLPSSAHTSGSVWGTMRADLSTAGSLGEMKGGVSGDGSGSDAMLLWNNAPSQGSTRRGDTVSGHKVGSLTIPVSRPPSALFGLRQRPKTAEPAPAQAGWLVSPCLPNKRLNTTGGSEEKLIVRRTPPPTPPKGVLKRFEVSPKWDCLFGHGHTVGEHVPLRGMSYTLSTTQSSPYIISWRHPPIKRDFKELSFDIQIIFRWRILTTSHEAGPSVFYVVLQATSSSDAIPNMLVLAYHPEQCVFRLERHKENKVKVIAEAPFRVRQQRPVKLHISYHKTMLTLRVREDVLFSEVLVKPLPHPPPPRNGAGGRRSRRGSRANARPGLAGRPHTALGRLEGDKSRGGPDVPRLALHRLYEKTKSEPLRPPPDLIAHVPSPSKESVASPQKRQLLVRPKGRELGPSSREDEEYIFPTVGLAVQGLSVGFSNFRLTITDLNPPPVEHDDPTDSEVSGSEEEDGSDLASDED
eukprot:Rmarinus@m.22954